MRVKTSTVFEIVRVLVHFDQVAGCIVNPNHGSLAFGIAQRKTLHDECEYGDNYEFQRQFIECASKQSQMTCALFALLTAFKFPN